MLFTHLIKFIHLICVLGLLVSVSYCVVARGVQPHKIRILNKNIFWLSITAMLTGTLLVHPKFFTFHTPWIQAAYLLLACFIAGVWLTKKLSPEKRWIRRGIYLILMIILIMITHDAVTKTTFL